VSIKQHLLWSPAGRHQTVKQLLSTQASDSICWSAPASCWNMSSLHAGCCLVACWVCHMLYSQAVGELDVVLDRPCILLQMCVVSLFLRLTLCMLGTGRLLCGLGYGCASRMLNADSPVLDSELQLLESIRMVSPWSGVRCSAAAAVQCISCMCL
jgi:hypothetical protein